MTARILVIDDDVDLLALMKHWLTRAGFSVVGVTDIQAARQFLNSEKWTAVIADVEMPDGCGLDLISEARLSQPLASTLVISAHQRFDYAVRAMRANADDMLSKPLDEQSFVRSVQQLCARASAKAKTSHVKRIWSVLAIGAHPDDVELGCGGTLLRHRQLGHRIAVLTLSGGEQGGAQSEREAESARAASLLGANLVFGGLVDTRITEGPDTIEVIAEAIRAFQPEIIYTHSENDVHQDHRNVHAATLVAARRVSNLLAYQSPSATIDFRPTLFVEVGDYLSKKVELIACYESQVVCRPYLRTEHITSTANYWGRFAGYKYVEPFESVRITDYGLAGSQATSMFDGLQKLRTMAP